MTAALLFLLRYRRQILAVVIVLLLLIAQCSARENDQNGCATSAGAAAVGGLVYPVDPNTAISSGYGYREGGEFHRGVDFAVPVGTPVRALSDGTVTAAQDQGVGGFGGWVVLAHTIDGTPMSTVYGHINPGGVHVKLGQQVRAGDVIAASGNAGESSGPHLHFELHDSPDRIQQYNPVDPTSLLERIRSGQTTTTGGAEQQVTARASTSEIVDRNAAAIIAAGLEDGVPEKAIVIALAVGLVESELRNLASEKVPESTAYPNDGVDPGDHASVGVLQQQVDMGYGTVAELMQPKHQAREFFRRLLATNWQSKSLTEAAADVQRPRAELRGKYAAREVEARELFARLVRRAAAGEGCSPVSPTSPGQGTGQGAEIVAAARRLVGTPYVWGGGDEKGATNGGVDCSGLTLFAVHAATGQHLPHFTGDRSQPGQLQMGTPVTDLSHAAPGDLVFFGSDGDAVHVGVYSGTKDGTPLMIHAPTSGQTVTEAPVSVGGNLIAIRRFTTSHTT
ncbi:peptidoglycan DD-metalloendopeptidase family protein (plasmid) [Nocardia sp. NBC_01377]|uniref:peptidoglycan DD-metalloendopeptidase family protein n=1 Tax=Nocardia sp. NBC_01377 TaxID=2903595 RepID=UPI002F90F947